MNVIYNTAVSLYALAARIVALRNKKAKLMIEGQKRTFGILDSRINPEEKYVWIHVSSLGEFEQGRPLIEMIKQQTPDKKILLTFFSPSGYKVCKNYGLADVICYLPFDLPRNVKRFLGAVRIEKAIFVKYEFWGNYLTQLKKHGIPTYIISAIFRPTQAFFKPYGGMFRKMLHCYDKLFVQDKASADLLESIGVTNVAIAGDTRFDRVTDILDNKIDLPVVESFSRGQFTLIAGSSWEPDEDLLIPYFNTTPEMKMIIAPHEITPERIAGIRARLKRKTALYSEASEATAAEADCLIIDCYGILSKCYRFASVAYIGGGFGVGIHNINEAAVYGIPVVFGPNYRKFKEAHDLLRLGGAFTVNGDKEFSDVMNKFLGDGVFLTEHGKIAGNYIRDNIGATERVYRAIF